MVIEAKVPEAEEAAPAEAKPKRKFRAVFVGGAFLQGVPARDLSEEEWNKIPKRKQEAAIAGGIFKIEGGR